MIIARKQQRSEEKFLKRKLGVVEGVRDEPVVVLRLTEMSPPERNYSPRCPRKICERVDHCVSIFEFEVHMPGNPKGCILLLENTFKAVSLLTDRRVESHLFGILFKLRKEGVYKQVNHAWF